MGEKRSYCIVVEGQYYGAHDASGAPVVKKYVAKFMLPSQEAALSTICKYLLDPYLRKHYGDYARFRSHRITSVTTDGRLPNPAVLRMAFEDMGVADLDDFCTLKQIFIDPYKHKDLEKCREEVKRVWQERESQMKADKTSGMAKEKVEADELLKLNELPPSGDNPEINVNQQKIGIAIKKGGVDARAIDPGVDAPLAESAPVLPAAEEDLLG